MKHQIKKRAQHKRRHLRIRARIFGTKSRPRLSVFRSNKHVWLQLIDDGTHKTICSASDRDIHAKAKKEKTGKRVSRAFAAGKLLAERAEEHKITHAVFDRGGYRYHGIIKMAADGAREGGLTF